MNTQRLCNCHPQPSLTTLSRSCITKVILAGSYMMTSSNGNIFSITGPLCGNSPITGEFPAQRPVTRSFDVFFDMRRYKPLSKQSWGWRFETPSRSLWRHFNEEVKTYVNTHTLLTCPCCGLGTAFIFHFVEITLASRWRSFFTKGLSYNSWPKQCV